MYINNHRVVRVCVREKTWGWNPKIVKRTHIHVLGASLQKQKKNDKKHYDYDVIINETMTSTSTQHIKILYKFTITPL